MYFRISRSITRADFGFAVIFTCNTYSSRTTNDSHAWERAHMSPSGCVFSNLSSLFHTLLGCPLAHPSTPPRRPQEKNKGKRSQRLDRHRLSVSLSVPTQLILTQPRSSFTRASSRAQNLTFRSTSPPAESSLTVSSQRESLLSTTRLPSSALFLMLSTASTNTLSSPPFTYLTDPRTSSTAPTIPTVTLPTLACKPLCSFSHPLLILHRENSLILPTSNLPLSLALSATSPPKPSKTLAQKSGSQV